MKAGIFLGVFSVEQGKERIRLWQIITVTFFCLFLYELLSTLLWWNVVNSDSRDVVDDFRKTLPAVQRSHDKFYNDNDLYQFQMSLHTTKHSVTVSEVGTEVFHSREIPNPIYDSLPESFKSYFTDTQSRAKYYTSRVRIQFGSFGEVFDVAAKLRLEFTDQRGAVTCNDDACASNGTRVNVVSNGYTNMYQMRFDEPGHVALDRVAKVVIYLYFKDHSSDIIYVDQEPATHYPSWRISHMRTHFEPWWAGDSQLALNSAPKQDDASRKLYPPDTDELDVLIELRDVNQPYPDYPKFANKSQILVALLLGLAGIICLLYYGYLSYTIRLNAALNNNRPPPFFAGMRKFRGW